MASHGKPQSESPSRRPGPAPKGYYLSLWLIGCLLTLVYSLLTPRIHSYSHDGRQVYVGARLLLHGDNPYDHDQLRRGYMRYTHEGSGDTDHVGVLTTLPATLAFLTLFSEIPWPLYCWLQMALSAFCIPLIAHFCLHFLIKEPSIRWLWLGSIGIAAFAPTWQNMVLGQSALPVLLCLLLALDAAGQRNIPSAGLPFEGSAERRPLHREVRPGGDFITPAILGLFSFLSLLKLTLSFPFLLSRFLAGKWRDRAAILLAIGLFLGLNLIAISRVGFGRFEAAYPAEISRAFAAGGENDANGPASNARVDMEALLTPFAADTPVLRILLAALLVAPWIVLILRQKGAGYPGLCASCVLALVLFYHRTYDAALLVPACFLAVTAYKTDRTRPAGILLGIGLLACLISLGNHNLLDMLLHPWELRQPAWFKAHGVLVCALALLWYLSLLPPPSARKERPPEPRLSTEASDHE